MKKIIILMVLIFISFSLISCNNNKNPKFWGETYGPEELIDGFRVCLRTDGYYQIVGITKDAINDNTFVIPQYINNIPVMGYGALASILSAEAFSKFIYNDNKSFPLEVKGNPHMTICNINGDYMFPKEIRNANKIYICCHHVNGNISNFKGAWTGDGIMTVINYSINNMSVNQLLIDNDYDKLAIRIFLSHYDYLQIFDSFEEYLNDNPTEREHFEDNSLKFATAIVSNVEFHYNLYINGEEYHSFTHPENDLYWIDYVDNSEKLMEPPVPYVEGQTFLGWYKDKECTIPYNFATEVVHEVENEFVWLNLYAKWEQSI